MSFRSYNVSTDAEEVIATAWIGADGAVTCDDASLLAEWQEQGVVGRFGSGRLYPKDGVAFLEELPYMYRSVYMMAVWE